MTTSSGLLAGVVAPPQLDHIVHLVRPGKLQMCIAMYEKLGFSVERGGDGLTQNALIILTDGVYLELIEFLEKPPKDSGQTLQQWRENRGKHWWWNKKEGWVDWCLKGGVKDGRVAQINQASKLAYERSEDKSDLPRPDLVRYDEARPGGRNALSGKHIKWNVTFPHGSNNSVRGRYPFWCEDVTPRWWRVPVPAPQHPNLTRGLAAMTLLYYPETFPSRLASLQLILNSSADSVEDMLSNLIDTDPPPMTEGKAALPNEQVELYLATPDGPPLPIRVKAAEDPDEIQWLQENGEGLWEVEISVASDKLPPTAPPDGVERDTHSLGYGRLRLHPIHSVVPQEPAAKAQ